MKKFRTIIAGTVTLATILSMTTACSSGGSSGTASQGASETIYEPSWDDNSAVNDATASLASTVDSEGLKVDNKLVWMAWWKIDETTPAVKLFKQLYGTPATTPEGYEAKSADDAFINVNVGYAERYTQVAKMIQAGNSPDIFPFEIGNYPYSVYKNMFQPVDDLFDFSSDEWADYSDVIKCFEWGGKNYCPITELNIADLLWYRKSVVEDAGLQDPWGMYEDGTWDWDAFLEMCRDFRETGDDCYALDGYNPENALVCTTGTGLLSINDGKLVSNLNNANMEKCMEMLTKFKTEDLRYPRENNGWSPNLKLWASGKTLFFEDGTWAYESSWSRFRDSYKWEDDEIQFVPFPRMTGSDTYYQSMKQDAIMFVTGSKNADGYKAWIKANLASAKDENTKVAARAQSQEKFGWTDDLLDRLELVRNPKTFTAVFDFKNGIGTDIADGGTQDSPVEQLTKYPYMNGDSYTQIRATNEGVINARVDELNKSVQ